MLLLQGWYANMSSKLKPHINQQRLQKCPKKWRGTSIILDPPKKNQTSWQVWGSLALRGASGDFSPVPRAAVDDDLDGMCSRMKFFFKLWGSYWREWKHHWFAGAFLSQRPEWCGDLEVIHALWFLSIKLLQWFACWKPATWSYHKVQLLPWALAWPKWPRPRRLVRWPSTIGNWRASVWRELGCSDKKDKLTLICWVLSAVFCLWVDWKIFAWWWYRRILPPPPDLRWDATSASIWQHCNAIWSHKFFVKLQKGTETFIRSFLECWVSKHGLWQERSKGSLHLNSFLFRSFFFGFGQLLFLGGFCGPEWLRLKRGCPRPFAWGYFSYHLIKHWSRFISLGRFQRKIRYE